MRLLIVEPDEYYHPQYLSLRDVASEVRIEKNAARAKQALQSFLPDVLIMELLLPDQPGYYLLEHVGRIFRDRLLPVIIYSRIENLEDIMYSLNYGITGYFVKGKNSISDIKKLILNLSPI
ncbi:MAG: response regulator [Candidatus Doudnabacteria bacterium]|nr:response regulator [Candidatus Doudnabacteria bacterium]